MLMTYAELLQAVQDYCENSETSFVNNIPFFTKQAEERIVRDTRLPFFRKQATGTLTASTATLSMPGDFLLPFNFSVEDSDDAYFLLPKEESFIRTAYPDDAVEGRPRFYSVVDDSNFLLGPTPDSNYSYELRYYYTPTSIVTDSTTYIGTNCSAALLYGVLKEAGVYLKEDADVIANYDKMYAEAIEQAKTLGAVNIDEYALGY
jgi:hypothetical protein